MTAVEDLLGDLDATLHRLPFLEIVMPVELSSWLVAWRGEISNQRSKQWSTSLPLEVAKEMLSDGDGRLIVAVRIGTDANTWVVVPVAFYKLTTTEKLHPWGYMGLAGLVDVPSRLFPPRAHVLSKMQKNPFLDADLARTMRGFGTHELLSHVFHRVADAGGNELWIDFKHGNVGLEELYERAGFEHRRTVHPFDDVRKEGFAVWSRSIPNEQDQQAIVYVDEPVAAEIRDLMITERAMPLHGRRRISSRRLHAATI